MLALLDNPNVSLDLEARNDGGNTALHLASAYGFDEVTEKVLARLTSIIVGLSVRRGLPARAATIAMALLALLVLFLHRENIGRLRAGTEPKVGSKK